MVTILGRPNWLALYLNDSAMEVTWVLLHALGRLLGDEEYFARGELRPRLVHVEVLVEARAWPTQLPSPPPSSPRPLPLPLPSHHWVTMARSGSRIQPMKSRMLLCRVFLHQHPSAQGDIRDRVAKKPSLLSTSWTRCSEIGDREGGQCVSSKGDAMQLEKGETPI